MAAGQVTIYFDRQEDALLFALAASDVLAQEGASSDTPALSRIVKEISKARRITADQVRSDQVRSEHSPELLRSIA